MDQDAVSEKSTNREHDRASTAALAQRLNFESVPSTRGRFVRDDERPRTESYGELLQRASVFMRRR